MNPNIKLDFDHEGVTGSNAAIFQTWPPGRRFFVPFFLFHFPNQKCLTSIFYLQILNSGLCSLRAKRTTEQCWFQTV
jgi:hypothetical protein